MVAITAAQIKNENDWTNDDITSTNLEYLIDKAINWVNSVAGQSMSNLTGVAGSKTVTVTAKQGPVVKDCIGLLMRAYLEKGPNTAISSVSMNMIVTDPHFKVTMKFFMIGLQHLRGRTIVRA